MRRNLVVQLLQAGKSGEGQGSTEGAGDSWTWTAIDSNSKLIASYLIGNRDAHAQDFMHSVADRLATRVQPTTDGHDA